MRQGTAPGGAGTRPGDRLEAVWDRHTDSEFRLRSAEETVATMGPTPYLLHLPTLAGAEGRDAVRRFYADRFIPSIPRNVRLRLLSRTVGKDQVVDELLFEFTHDRVIDFMLPKVRPTGRRVSVPLVAVVGIRKGKVHHEHIYWDQASVLRQVGLLRDPRLPVVGVRQSRELARLMGRHSLR